MHWRAFLPLPLLLLTAALPMGARATTSGVLGLNGSSWLEIEDAPELNPTGGITIEAWVRPTSFSNVPTIVGKSWWTGYWLGLNTEGRVRFYTNGLSTRQDGVRSLPLARWSHVAVTFDGTTRRYYVNGALDYQAVTPGPLPIPSVDLAIGADAGSYRFSGNLAEVRIWNHARSQAQIQADLVRQIDSPQPGLIAAFTLDGNGSEIAERFEATPHGTPTFAGATPAPPVRSGPWQIPRLAAAPVLDGNCLDGEWGFFKVPLYYDATSTPAWVRLGATAFSLHACFTNLPRSEVAFPSEASIQIDRSDDDSFLPDGDDLRVELDETNAITLQRGLDGGSGWYDDSLLASFFSAQTNTASEFTWSAEFSISRLLFPSTPGHELGMSFIQDIFSGIGDRTAWPANAQELFPGMWTAMTVDDASAPPPDARAPAVRIGSYRSHSPVTLAGREVEFEPSADDDVDMASLEIYVDGALAEACDFPGANDLEVGCPHRAHYSPGRHFIYALARDHVGRITTSERLGFSVMVDGLAPTIEITPTPAHPLPGQTVRLTARASDESGVEGIEVLASAPPYVQTCEFPPGVTEAECELVVPPSWRTWYRYQATARDLEDTRARTGTRYLIYPVSAADLDHDGLPDELEFGLCTSPSNPDSDFDGLSDKAEVIGLDTPTGGFVNLPEMRADPCRRDVFLQYDYEVGARVELNVVTDVQTAYRDHGINLHVDAHERLRPPGSPVSSLNSIAAAYQRDSEGNYYFAPERNYTHYYAYSRHRVGRSGAWSRFFTFDIYTGGDGADDDGDDNDCECPLSESDPQLHCGEEIGCRRDAPWKQARRFMHELGHVVGLGHGGQVGSPNPRVVGDYVYHEGLEWDSVNQKPNHFSVMNYLYNGGGYCINESTPFDRAMNPSTLTFLDYAGTAPVLLPALSESALDERLSGPLLSALNASSCPDTVYGYRPSIAYTCFDARYAARGDDPAARVLVVNDGTQTVARLVAGSSWSFPDPAAEPDGIDWNCDGAISASVSGNVNGDGGDYVLPDEICNGVNDDPEQDLDVDEGCDWSLLRGLATTNEWMRIPRQPECIHLYQLNDADDNGSPDRCYVQPLAYRTAMGSIGTELDCRMRIDSDLPGGDCSYIPMVFPGLPLDEEIDQPVAPELPNLELCNESDDDGDGEVDEGCLDGDGDGISDAVDNCPATPNADQIDANGDVIGDACDTPPAVANVSVSPNPNGGYAISWPASTGEVRGYRVYRERTLDGLVRHVGDTAGTALLDAPAEPGPWTYRVFPLDLQGSENLVTYTDSVPVPEPDAVLGLLSSLACLGCLARRRAARRRPAR